MTLPDQVAEAQREYWGRGESIVVMDERGEPELAYLRGDLYGLDTPEPGDPVVELVRDLDPDRGGHPDNHRPPR